MVDYSFLRLKPSFAEAKQIFDPKQAPANVRHYDCIQLHPQETYLQITNSDVDIAFDNDYTVHIIDTAGNNLKDITVSVTIEQFIDVRGVKQIAFEIVNIGEEWGGFPVMLKFTHTTGSEVFYSNPFTVSSEQAEYTLRLDYTNVVDYMGTDYENAPYIQSIRFKGQFQTSQDETEVSKYIQRTGNVVSKEAVIVFAERFTIENITNLAFRALAVAVKSETVFIDGYRSTDSPQLKNGNRLGNSNTSNADITIYRDYTDQFNPGYQLTQPFEALSFYPVGGITVGNHKLKITFNKSVVIGSGQIFIWAEGGAFITLVDQFTQLSPNVIESVEFIDGIEDIQNYYVTVPIGLFQSQTGEQFEITDNTTWTFNITAGDWLSTDFLSTDFLIHT